MHFHMYSVELLLVALLQRDQRFLQRYRILVSWAQQVSSTENYLVVAASLAAVYYPPVVSGIVLGEGIRTRARILPPLALHIDCCTWTHNKFSLPRELLF